MNYKKIMTIAAIVASIAMTSSVFAFGPDELSKSAPTKGLKVEQLQKEPRSRDNCDFSKDKDPLTMLQNRKAKVEALLKEGKITQAEASSKITRIDAKIKEVKEFNALTVPQKKAKLLSNFKAKLDEKVKEEKITQEKADKILKAYTEKINAWDGTGYPRFKMHHKGHGDSKGHGPRHRELENKKPVQ